LLSKLSELVGVRTIDEPFGQKDVLAGGVPLVLADQAVKVDASVDANDTLNVTSAALQTPLALDQGTLGAVVTVRNTLLPQYRSQLDSFAKQLVESVDGAHATGLGLNGPASRMVAGRTVNSVNVPLSQAGLAYPPTAGPLYISVTDLATGARTLQKIDIDPNTQSLKDVAAALSSVPHLQGIADPQTGRLTVLANSGYGFDFAGRPSTSPDVEAITGTTSATIGGTFAGTSNDALTFTAVGSGTVGQTAGLTLEVRNSAGTLLQTLDLGPDYQAGTDLPAVDGIRVQLQAGTLNAGDSFTVKAIAQPDSGGVLTALGLNTFFAGNGAANFQVNANLRANPQDLALSATGDPGDGTILKEIVAAADQRSPATGTTLSESVASINNDLAGRINDLQQQQTAQQAVGQELQAQRQSTSGVDPNEELVRMLQFQRSFQVSAKFLTTINDTMDALLQIL
jgi:flagellar hook-associated protein 1 FlgK